MIYVFLCIKKNINHDFMNNMHKAINGLPRVTPQCAFNGTFNLQAASCFGDAPSHSQCVYVSCRMSREDVQEFEMDLMVWTMRPRCGLHAFHLTDLLQMNCCNAHRQA